MPIQFRCIHCRQLLGISNNRAGSQVDCPACGRTLRVPFEVGGTAIAENTVAPVVDAGLLGALSELASLSENNTSTTHRGRAGTRNAGAKSNPEPLTPPVARKRDSLRIVPLTPTPTLNDDNSSAAMFESPERVFEQLANLPPAAVDDSPSIVVDTEPVPDEETQTSRDPRVDPWIAEQPSQSSVNQKARRDSNGMNRELTDALVELAESTHTNTASIKTRGVHVEQIRDIETNRPRSLRNAVLATLLTLVAFAAGIYSARYFPVRQNGASDVADATKTEGNGDQVVLKQEIPVNPDPDDIETITGTITYVDSNGADKPDSQALVLLLPTTNAANLLLSAAPLRDLEPTSARSAIESALGVLGVTTTRANDQGQFRLPRKTTTAGVLIVISRHAARPDGQSPDPEVQSALAKWFDSPTQLLGRLSAQARPLSAFIKDSLVPPCEIKFTPAK